MAETANGPANPALAELWRGGMLESVHRGSAVVATAAGEVVAAWGEPSRVILPRSAAKMIQALPLVESGAEGVFVGILPARGLGIALKIDDGASRASAAAMAALLARFGALDRGHPLFVRLADAPLTNWRGIEHGHLRAAPALIC